MSDTTIPFPSAQYTDFDPETVNVLAAAFEDAWEAIVRAGNMFASPRYAGAAREIVARRVVDVAKRGERSQSRLRDDAVAYLVRSYRA